MIRDSDPKAPRLTVPVLLRAEWKCGEKTIVQEAVSEWISAQRARLKINDMAPSGRILLENPANHRQVEAGVVSVEGPEKPLGTYRIDVDFDSSFPQFWDRVYCYSDNGLEILYVAEGAIAAV